jgi:RNA polymerase sigma-70 factor (ECF subfamily)
LPLDLATIERLFNQANAERWALPRDVFADAVNAGVRRAFADRDPSARDLDRYIATLHLPDLALACACALGHEAAWEHFVLEWRPVLYRAADALDPTGGARELADSLYADLYGLGNGRGERRSLFRYFHGRSSLATWLRAVLAQRHVDRLRTRRRSEPLPDEDVVLAPMATPQDPDKPRLVGLVHRAFRTAIDRLSATDRFRLRSYYLVDLTLAQIGRVAGEHEATVSRHLARIRRVVREDATRQLREEMKLQTAEVERALQLALEDPGDLDLRELFGTAEHKKSPPRSF